MFILFAALDINGDLLNIGGTLTGVRQKMSEGGACLLSNARLNEGRLAVGLPFSSNAVLKMGPTDHDDWHLSEAYSHLSVSLFVCVGERVGFEATLGVANLFLEVCDLLSPARFETLADSLSPAITFRGLMPSMLTACHAITALW